MEPGDVIPFEIIIKSDSKHTYRYKNGSFILATPDASKCGDADDSVVGFDGQSLPQKFQFHDVANKIGMESMPSLELLVQSGVLANVSGVDNHPSKLSVEEWQKIQSFLAERYPSSEKATTELLEQYVLDYYLDPANGFVKDGETAETLSDLVSSNLAVKKDVFTTGNNRFLEINIDNDSVKTGALDAIINTTDGVTNSIGAIKYYLEELYVSAGKTDAQIATMKSKTNVSNLRTQVKTDFGGTGNDVYKALSDDRGFAANNVTALNQVYDLCKGAGKAKELFMSTLGLGDNIVNTPGSAGPAVFVGIKPAARYNNFFNNVFSVVYGKESISEIAGDIKAIFKTEADADFYLAHGYSVKDFHEYVSSYEKGILDRDAVRTLYRDPTNDEIGTLITLQNKNNVIDDEDGRHYVLDVDGNKCYLEPVSIFSHHEAQENCWVSDVDAGLTVGDYMASMPTQSGAWEIGNDFFKNLLASGVNGFEATWRAFNMAVNYDGENAGNDYQDALWPWYNSIQLERADGSFEVVKVDDAGNVLGDDATEEETSFYLWKINDQGTEDTSDDTYEYCVYVPEDPEAGTEAYYTFVEYNENTKEMDLTVRTQGGSLQIDYAMLKDIVYYLQEAVAPDGYKLDPTIRVICNEDQFAALKDSNPDLQFTNAVTGESATAVWAGGGIDPDETLIIQFENVEDSSGFGEDDSDDSDDQDDSDDSNKPGEGDDEGSDNGSGDDDSSDSDDDNPIGPGGEDDDADNSGDDGVDGGDNAASDEGASDNGSNGNIGSNADSPMGKHAATAQTGDNAQDAGIAASIAALLAGAVALVSRKSMRNAARGKHAR